jgi:hypothetical protein
MWFHHYRFVHAQASQRGMDWWWNAASPPDGRGFFNFSYGTNNSNIFQQTAKRLVLEVRSDYPWAEGGARRYPSYEARRQYKTPFHSDFWGFDWDPYQSGK